MAALFWFCQLTINQPGIQLGGVRGGFTLHSALPHPFQMDERVLLKLVQGKKRRHSLVSSCLYSFSASRHDEKFTIFWDWDWEGHAHPVFLCSPVLNYH